MDIVSIPHHDGEIGKMPDLSWRKGGAGVMVRCPNGHEAWLDHDVDDDGIVAPSLVCPNCTWHVMGSLEGWAASK